ncbi:MAG: DUF2062 domain-containing protein [Gallionella sp.]
MRKLIRQFLPKHDTIKSSRWLKPFGSVLQHHNLWHLHRRSVSGGVAVGMFCGLIPPPFQFITAGLCAILFRVNLPVSVFTTLYTNPFTMLPLYALAWKIGAWVSGVSNGANHQSLAIPELHWDNWTTGLMDWFIALGKPILIGVPLLGIALSITGYLVVRVAWRVGVIYKWKKRNRLQQKG